MLDALFTPFPPVRPATRLLRRWGVAGTLDFTRLALLSVRRLGEEEFGSEEARILLSGNAMHSDVSPDSAGSALFGWLLAMLGQDVGFPVPEGGAGMLATALRRRAESLGVQVRCGVAVTSVEVTGGRAVGVRLADGTTVRARHGILADVPAPTLYGRARRRTSTCRPGCSTTCDRFEWDDATLKVNWALDAPIPWTAPGARSAGTVHLGVDHDGLVDVAADLAVGRMPRSPFILLGQMTTSDPTRSPAGTESAWAYTHLPRQLAHDDDRVADQAERLEGCRGARWRRGSSTCAAADTSRRPGDWRRRTPTSAGVRSTPAPRRCTSSSCCARRGVSGGRRRPSAVSTSPAHRPTPAVACTERAAGTPPSPRFATARRSGWCAGHSSAARGLG